MDSSINIQLNQSSLTSNTVRVYLRNYKKQANLIVVSTPIKPQQLKKIIAVKLSIKQQYFKLFCSGKDIDQYLNKKIELRNNMIIHFIDLRRTIIDKLTIYFKYEPNGKIIEVIVKNTKDKIKSIFQSHIKPILGLNQKQIFFAYLGKPINIFKTYQQQLIEDRCQIYILHFRKQLQISKQYSKLSKSRDKESKILQQPNVSQSWKEGNQKKFNSYVKKKISSLSSKKQEQTAPPQRQQLANADQGYDLHKKVQKPFSKKNNPIQKKQNLSNIQKQKIIESINPQSQKSIKQTDLLYSGHNQMQQINNFTGEVANQYKKIFLQKKSSKDNQNKI